MKNNKILIILTISITLLLLIGGAFYWYEWRPTQIREQCWKDSLKENTNGTNMILQNYINDTSIPVEKRRNVANLVNSGKMTEAFAVNGITTKYGDKYGLSGTPLSFEDCLKIYGIKE
jgi:hypothetical protein